MWVAEQVAAQVVEVLTRAESLFAAPGDGSAPATAADATGAAVEASRAITAHNAELSGAAAQAHGDLLAAASQRLETAAGTDARLAEHLSHATETHTGGLCRATDLRAGAADVPAQLTPWTDIPASELAALKALRAQVAGMQQLTAQHSEQAANVAGEIRALGFDS